MIGRVIGRVIGRIGIVEVENVTVCLFEFMD